MYQCIPSSRLLKSASEPWAENRLSVPLYCDEDYNVPYNSAAAAAATAAAATQPGQQAFSLSFRASKVTGPDRVGPGLQPAC